MDDRRASVGHHHDPVVLHIAEVGDEIVSVTSSELGFDGLVVGTIGHRHDGAALQVGEGLAVVEEHDVLHGSRSRTRTGSWSATKVSCESHVSRHTASSPVASGSIHTPFSLTMV